MWMIVDVNNTGKLVRTWYSNVEVAALVNAAQELDSFIELKLSSGATGDAAVRLRDALAPFRDRPNAVPPSTPGHETHTP